MRTSEKNQEAKVVELLSGTDLFIAESRKALADANKVLEDSRNALAEPEPPRPAKKKKAPKNPPIPVPTQEQLRFRETIEEMMEFFEGDKNLLHNILDDFFTDWVYTGKYDGMPVEMMNRIVHFYIYTSRMFRVMPIPFEYPTIVKEGPSR